MAHSFFVATRLIKNLTPRPVTSYSALGDFVTLYPTEYSEKDTQDTLYIVEEDYSGNLDKDRLVRVGLTGTGRDGVEVSILTLYSNEIRILPYGE